MFKNPFSFEGRIRRTEYGISFIIYVVCAAILNGIVGASNGDAAIFVCQRTSRNKNFFSVRGQKN